jgi:hypothetical protein
MDLKMFLGNECIDSRKINAMKLNTPGYIDSLRFEMEERNEGIIDLSNEEPTFYIDTIPSAMNVHKRLFRN